MLSVVIAGATSPFFPGNIIPIIIPFPFFIGIIRTIVITIVIIIAFPPFWFRRCTSAVISLGTPFQSSGNNFTIISNAKGVRGRGMGGRGMRDILKAVRDV